MAKSLRENLKDILVAVEGHGKYHTSDYDGAVMTVEDGLAQAIALIKEKVVGEDEQPSYGADKQDWQDPEIRNDLRQSQRAILDEGTK